MTATPWRRHSKKPRRRWKSHLDRGKRLRPEPSSHPRMIGVRAPSKSSNVFPCGLGLQELFRCRLSTLRPSAEFKFKCCTAFRSFTACRFLEIEANLWYLVSLDR